MANYKDFMDVLFSPPDGDNSKPINNVFKKFKKSYSKRPAFFAPYASATEMAGGALAIAAYPAQFAISVPFIALATALSSVVSVGMFCLSAAAALCDKKVFCRDTYVWAHGILRATGLGLVLAALNTLLVFGSSLHALVTFSTRSIATAGLLPLSVNNDVVVAAEEERSDASYNV